MAFNVVYLIALNIDQNNKSIRYTWDIISIIYVGLNCQYLLSLRSTMTNPFDTKFAQFIHFIIVHVFLSLVLYTQLINIFTLTQNKQFALDLVFRYVYVLAIFTSYIQMDLKRTKVTQNEKVYKMKSAYLWQQIIWFYFSLIMQFIYAVAKNRLAIIFFMLQNIVFALCQLQERYPRLKLRSLLRLCSVEELVLISEIENGGIDSQLNIILLKNAQTVELVKSVLNGVCKAIYQSLKYKSLKYDKKRLYRFYFEFNEQGVDLELRAQTKNQHTRVELISHYPDHFRDLLRENEYESQSWIILETLGIQYNKDSYEKTRESMGRSGSFFFFSQNKRMILKTISQSELNTFLQNQRIEAYFQYLKQNPESKLAKIYGLLGISIIGMAPTQFILMENTLGSLNIDRLYDLKGSTIGRNSVESDSLYKDNYFLQSLDYPLRIQEDNGIKQQLIQDSAFLCRIGYMDYSLLFGITQMDKDNQQIQHRIIQVNNNNFAVLSIIDYLQDYNFNKKMEYYFKSIRAKDPNQLSCIEPEKYQQRFSDFIHQIIE